MENQEQKPQPTQAEIQAAQNEWIRSTLDRANKHLAEKGVIPKTILDKESRYIAPMCAIWKIKSQQGKTYWVVSGNLPTDHVEVTAATNARDALRHFSFQWQLKADELAKNSAGDKAQIDFANLLVNRAEGLYDLYSNEKLWTNEPK
ncbi:DUF4826 family protein [Pseudoalteromonas sp. MMG024]|uniref:DUF4826 family protein n=1 Tax=Pseudoalteromonas sp. MMG024 TaxID=2909980 RepID=UPI001F20A9C3|nr:DUF4826 family protein [Pseudoalteromonas sp. MMG024]MCF6455412.1 DUF4826 family protein [Pseudoalteromonas sp. MMG024]